MTSPAPDFERALRLADELAREPLPPTADPLDLYFAYRLMLGRVPEPAGWRTWMAAVERGMTRETMVLNMLASEEFRRRHETRTVRVDTVRGFALHVDPHDADIGQPIVAHRDYEPHVTAALLRELRDDSVLLDIGANMGWFTMLAAHRCPQGRVIAVEPSPLNLQLLYRNVADSGVANVTIWPFAATDRDRILELHFVRSNAYVGDASPDHEFATRVPGRPLDALLGSEPRIDVIKIDIEGHEPVALAGMTATLRRTRPVILSEFHPKAIREHVGHDPRAYLVAIERFGYRWTVLARNGAEIAVDGADGVMREWEAGNRAAGETDRLHLDLLARPA